ncbi:MAG: hypothetical protein K0S09_916 [Sphingobacteriaceae bacterium]|jgi:hypothetical protein|nr:hypothetical protein [Sphingobacteriaceae bacterium]
MDKEREQWVARVLDSAEEVKGLHAPGHLFPRILESVQKGENEVVKLPLGQIRIALAAACILVLLNVGILLTAKRIAPTDSSNYIESYDLNLYK